MKYLERQARNKMLWTACSLICGVALLVVLSVPSVARAATDSAAQQSAAAAPAAQATQTVQADTTTVLAEAQSKDAVADQSDSVVARAVSVAEPLLAYEDANKADDTNSTNSTDGALAAQQDEQATAKKRAAAPRAAAAANYDDNLVEGDVYYIHSKVAPDKVLDVAWGSKADGANVLLWKKNNGANQRWRLIRNGEHYLFINEATNKALDIADGQPFNEANVQQYQPNYTDGQKWILNRMADGSYSIVSAVDPTFSLDLYAGKTANGTNVQLYTNNGGNNQKWVLENVTGALREAKQAQDNNRLPEGDYLIETKVTDGKAVDVDYPTAESGSNVLLWQTTRHKTQVWHVSYDKDGLAKLTNKYSGKALDANGGMAANGVNVQQWDANDSMAQRWLIVKMADGTYKILSAINPKFAVDLHASQTNNNANIELYGVHDGANQRWRFTSLDIHVPQTDLEVAHSLDPNAMYRIVSSANPSYAVDVYAGKTANGTNAQLYTKNNGANQAFMFEPAAKNGYFLLKSLRGNIALASNGDNPTSGNNAQFWETHADDKNQQFAIIRNADGTYSFRSVSTGLLLDINGDPANEANLYLTSFSTYPSDTQKFRIEKITDIIPSGLYSVAAAGSKTMALTTDGASLTIASNAKRLNQKWAIRKVGGKDNTYTLQSLDTGAYVNTLNGKVHLSASSTTSSAHWVVSFVQGNLQFKNELSDTVLDITNNVYASGISVGMWLAHGGTNQQWTLSQAIELENGTYEINAAVGNNMALDVDGGSSQNGANVQIYTRNHSAAQKWTVRRLASGAYVFTNVSSGKVLDLYNNEVKNGSNILQYASNGGSNQHWYVEWNIKGYFVLRSALNPNYVIDVTGGHAVNSTNVELYAYHGGVAQGWNFFRVSAATQQHTGTFRLYLDAGHGYSAPNGWDPGATTPNYREADLTHELVDLIALRLDKKGIAYRKSQDDGVNFDRRQEAARDHGCTTLLSIHFNASPNATATGFESFRHACNAEPGSLEFQSAMHEALKASVGLRNRGMNTQEIAVISGKKGHLPATLLEIAFVTNANDMYVYQQRKFIIADALANAIEQYAKEYYGGGSDTPHADESQNDVPFTPDYQSNSENPVDPNPDLPNPPSVDEDISSETYTIMGNSTVTARQMVALYKQIGKQYPSSVYSAYGAPTIEKFCQLVMEEAAAEGVRAEVVFAQAMHETGWLQFGGDVKNWQCNFAGLGAVGGGVRGEDFSGYGAEGVCYGLRAQVQHLKGYASTDALNNACVDNRFKYLTPKRGSAPTISGLTGTWAMDPAYARGLFSILRELKETPQY